MNAIAEPLLTKPAASARRRGAPPGNRNALKHGRRTAEACAARAEARAHRLAQFAQQADEDKDKKGGPPSQFLRNKPNNSVAGIQGAAATSEQDTSERRRRRGAPKGNHNAFRHGRCGREFATYRHEVDKILESACNAIVRAGMVVRARKNLARVKAVRVALARHQTGQTLSKHEEFAVKRLSALCVPATRSNARAGPPEQPMPRIPCT